MRPEIGSGAAGEDIESITPAGSPMDRALGRIGFMSTQRRENRRQRVSCTERARDSVPTSSALDTAFARANAGGLTAQPMLSAGLATNSLHSDHHLEQLVWQDNRSGSPLSGPSSCAASGARATRRSSLLHIPFPSGLASFHPALPQAPAGRRRWAERYDGKRDLYLQHAA